MNTIYLIRKGSQAATRNGSAGRSRCKIDVQWYISAYMARWIVTNQEIGLMLSMINTKDHQNSLGKLFNRFDIVVISYPSTVNLLVGIGMPDELFNITTYQSR